MPKRNKQIIKRKRKCSELARHAPFSVCGGNRLNKKIWVVKVNGLITKYDSIHDSWFNFVGGIYVEGKILVMAIGHILHGLEPGSLFPKLGASIELEIVSKSVATRVHQHLSGGYNGLTNWIIEGGYG